MPESRSQSLQPATLFKKRLPRVFFREFSGIFKNNFSQRHLRAGAACYFFCLGSGKLLTKKYFLRNVISLKWNDEWLRKPILKMNQPLSMSF